MTAPSAVTPTAQTDLEATQRLIAEMLEKGVFDTADRSEPRLTALVAVDHLIAEIASLRSLVDEQQERIDQAMAIEPMSDPEWPAQTAVSGAYDTGWDDCRDKFRGALGVREPTRCEECEGRGEWDQPTTEPDCDTATGSRHVTCSECRGTGTREENQQ